MDLTPIKKIYPELGALVEQEIARQENTLDLIASENICPDEVLLLLGSPLANKYSEGYPGKRYYPGNEQYDKIETLARENALKAFGLSSELWHVNVQPYSGSPANTAIYLALLSFGDVLMGMQLAHGGHLTHGHKVSYSGIAYAAVQYGVDPETEELDYDAIDKLAREKKPKLIVSGATAYPKKIDFARFRKIADTVDAYHVSDVSHYAGLIAAGEYPSPFPHADVVMMTTHKTLRGPRGAVIFSRKDKTGKDGKSISDLIDRAIFPGLQGGPHNNQTAAIALAFYLAQKPEYRSYQKQVIRNARALADALKSRGFDLFAGGTESHMMLVKLNGSTALTTGNKGIDGTEAENRLAAVGIIANRNAVPGDPSPFKPTGIRIGTPTVTTRGMKQKEMGEIAELINAALTQAREPGTIASDVLALCKKYQIG